MDTITLTKKQIENLTPYVIEKEIKNTESQLFILDKGNWNYCDGSLLLKKLYITTNEAMANKLFNVSLLKDKEEEIGIEELVIPQHLVAVKDNKNNPVIGFTTEIIDNCQNLGVILNNLKIPNEEKISLLYEVGQLLSKMGKLSKQNIDFFFSDLHEYNFLVLNDSKKLKVVDLDSAYLGNNYPMPSWYLATNPNLQYYKRKYKINKNGLAIPNKNSDLLCFNMMILNYISRSRVSSLSLDDYYSYINYLKYLGYGKDIISSFEKIYTPTANENPYNYFDQIPVNKVPESDYRVYQLRKSKLK